MLPEDRIYIQNSSFSKLNKILTEKKMNYKNLFLRQSYLDGYDCYANTVLDSAKKLPLWDYVVLTASNDSQAESYRQQIDYRLRKGYLPKETHYAVLPDFEGKRVGSGGATFGVMKYIREREEDFSGLRILVIHSGGDSKRVPQYSACGKLFSPVPHELPDGRRSTLFDEFIIAMSGVPSRMGEGMLVLSGDVLLLFNPLQIDFYGKGAAALSIKEKVETGKNHGVFLKGENGCVSRFLHKQTEETLSSAGAVDKSGKVNIDTGAVILGSDILNDLYKIVDTDEKFRAYVNETVRLSFYADFVYPMAAQSTLEEFYNEKPEGEFNNELKSAREVLWEILHKYSMKLICFSPASFLHFGTSKELLALVCDDIADYRFLDWSARVNCNIIDGEYAVYNSFIHPTAEISKGSYIENSDIMENVKIGKNCIISGVTLKDCVIEDGVILHGLKLNDGKFVVRKIGINDNPKENILFGEELECDLWDAPLFAEENTMLLAAEATLSGKRGEYSLKSSFNFADVTQILPWQDKLDDKIKVEKLIGFIENKVPVGEIDGKIITSRIRKYLLKISQKADFSLKIRIYYYLAKLTGDEELMSQCFATICEETLKNSLEGIAFSRENKIKAENVTVKLPVRVNWGGGWSDTPPYCLENGGTVLNASILLNGEKPIVVTMKHIEERKIILASSDIGSYKEFEEITELQSCNDPSDSFALHKAALIACGIIPRNEHISVKKICEVLGGGLYFNTSVINIPKGSGLGTSSILSAACVKAVFKLLGKDVTDNEIYSRVMCMEQLMSTGGGWQDQVGGVTYGFKLISTFAGLDQSITCKKLNVPENALKDLQERFCLIYTGQRRLARNLLREIVGKYIGNDLNITEILYKIQQYAILMKTELEKGNIKEFCNLLNRHWELSKQLDEGCTNTCIDQIFASIDDLTDAHMICGAGGGGFLQVVLKKGVSKDKLRERLWEVFADSGVEVYDCEFYFGG